MILWDGTGLFESRDARPYRGRRGWGRLQRFERVGVEKEGLKSHEGYSVSVHPWPFVWVAGNHNLAEGITDMAQRIGLLLSFFGVGDGKRRLYVYSL